MNLSELFRQSFQHASSREALEFRDETLTFGELDARANRVAALLADRGFVAGDRLAVYLENRIEFIDLFLACTRLGIIFVPINILYKEREVSHIISDAEPKALVASGPVPGGFARWDVSEIALSDGAGDFRGLSNGGGANGLDSASPAALVYTSGTTGTAKGAILTHGNFAANARALLDAWRITDRDRLLLPLPLFHVHGLGNGVCCWLASGCRMHMLPRFDAADAAREFLSFRPSVFFAVPTIYVRLLGIPDEIAREIGGFVRLFVSGSAPLAAPVFDAFRTKFGHAILERYGMTETFMNLSNPYDAERRPGTVGFPLPGVEIRIVRPDGAAAADGEEGQILVRGPNVFAGYWRRADATSAAFEDRWFKTGDIGRRSPDGYITLCGRMGDVIISGGFNIYPREIEEVLLSHPGVREAVVVGVPDDVRGEVPIAYLVADGTVSDEELRERSSRELASFKLPRAFIRVESLPRTALGKVQRHMLPPWR